MADGKGGAKPVCRSRTIQCLTPASVVLVPNRSHSLQGARNKSIMLKSSCMLTAKSKGMGRRYEKSRGQEKGEMEKGGERGKSEGRASPF